MEQLFLFEPDIPRDPARVPAQVWSKLQSDAQRRAAEILARILWKAATELPEEERRDDSPQDI